MCVLVAILWGHTFSTGLYKICAYDCGYDRPAYLWYDKAYTVYPNFICPARFMKYDRSSDRYRGGYRRF